VIDRGSASTRASTRVSTRASRRPATLTQLGTQFADGFGARFNALVLALYALEIGGLRAFSGLLAVGMLGSVLSAVVSSVGTSRIGARRTMQASAAVLASARAVSYAAVLTGFGVAPIMASRFVGSVTGGVLMAGAKSQAPRDERAAASLAWFSVANGGGQAAGAVAAGVVTAFATPAVVTVTGLAVGLGTIVPMYRIAGRSVAAAVPLREQLRGQRAAAPVAAFGALVTLVAMGLVSLSDALVVRLHSEAWLGPATAAAFTGALSAATYLRARPDVVRRDPLLAWPLLGVLALAGWQVAGMAWPFLLGTMAASGFAAQMLGAMVEHHVIHRVPPGQASPALAATAAAGSLASALALLVVPELVAIVGVQATAALLAAASLGVAMAGSSARRLALLPR